jgi:hypothetical protein
VQGFHKNNAMCPSGLEQFWTAWQVCALAHPRHHT